MLVEVVVALPIYESIMLSVYVKATFSIASEQTNEVIQMNLRWMQSIVNYLRIGKVPENGKQAHKICIQAIGFTLINDQLYRRSFGMPYLKCLNDMKAQYISVELHEVACDNHPRGRMLAHHAYS